MHIVAIIVGILSAIAIWSWRLQQAKRGAEEAGKLLETAANLPRRMRFQSKTRKGGLDAIEDPREAAAVMMMEVARGAGEVTAEHKAVMRAEIMQYFELSEAEADDLIAAAGWLGRDAPAPHAVMQKMSRFVLDYPGLGPKQFVDLSNMLDEVALIEGGPFEEQVALIRIYREKAGLRV